VVDASETRWPVTWCGACGAIALTQREAGATIWMQADLAQALETQAFARWARDMDALAQAAAEVTHALRVLAHRAGRDSKLGTEARRLEETTARLEHAAHSALGKT
jgi:hypothetical protein